MIKIKLLISPCLWLYFLLLLLNIRHVILDGLLLSVAYTGEFGPPGLELRFTPHLIRDWVYLCFRVSRLFWSLMRIALLLSCFNSEFRWVEPVEAKSESV